MKQKNPSPTTHFINYFYFVNVGKHDDVMTSVVVFVLKAHNTISDSDVDKKVSFYCTLNLCTSFLQCQVMQNQTCYCPNNICVRTLKCCNYVFQNKKNFQKQLIIVMGCMYIEDIEVKHRLSLFNDIQILIIVTFKQQCCNCKYIA